ncbi:hypothetical protein BXY66_0861 [Shimia isoporae]|uniref:Secreted protein n=1 Tax=Shimia isoporae TaxID=647720 RepID=A0A4R1NM72_9RHOB|nr:hypothetical protein [Shimia isoporae]TCL08821.1 hypothetical protein BXY66_0861 [Shimia isoporae]
MKFPRLCFLLALGTSPEFAIANCLAPTISLDGEGARFEVPDEAASAARSKKYGQPPEAGYGLVLHDGEGYWVPVEELTAVQVVLGTAFETYDYRGPDHCVPKGLPIETGLEAVSPEAVGLQPANGLWKLDLSPVIYEGCPDVMLQAVPADLVALPAEVATPQPLSFQVPFHPDQLEMSSRFPLEWAAMGDAQWQARAMEHIFSAMPSHGGKRSELLWTIEVLTPDSISHTSKLTFVLPPEAVAAFGTDHCSAKATGFWRRVEE